MTIVKNFQINVTLLKRQCHVCSRRLKELDHISRMHDEEPWNSYEIVRILIDWLNDLAWAIKCFDQINLIDANN